MSSIGSHFNGENLVVLQNADVISSGCRLKNCEVHLHKGTIIKLTVGAKSKADLPKDAFVIDLTGKLLIPGMIDLQIYGTGGKLFGGEPSLEALHQMEHDLASQGVTGFLATIATNTNEVVTAGAAAAKLYADLKEVENQSVLQNFWGLHLEGPFLNPQKRGAHPAHLIKHSSKEEAKKILSITGSHLRMMTLAPELSDEGVAELLHEHGVVVSAGHTNATYEEATSFLLGQPDFSGNSCTTPEIQAVVTTVTHLFNAMPAMHHRDPGLIPAVFEQRPFASIVCDGVHVSYPMVKLAKRELREKLFLITDAVTHTDRGIYQHRLETGQASAAGGRATMDRYVMPDGTLSGSALTLLRAVMNCVNECDIPIEEAVNMATLYPARVLGESNRKGQIAQGFDADICILNLDFEVEHTIIGGKCVYSKHVIDF
jgi:N-acetylglucosamine-6-phosphate deacetylase